MRFFLGSHMVNSLEKTNVPLFISRRTLEKRKSLLKPLGEWAIDSGGFSELNLYGKWTLTPEEYVSMLNRWSSMPGLLWAAQQDWMCEPHIIQKTGLTVREHQRKTIQNMKRLRELECKVHIIPVIQGWNLEDYSEHLMMWKECGFDLASEPLVGIGSVCRRQSSDEIKDIIQMIHSKGINLHGFGIKKAGLKKYGDLLHSADSLAWSFGARYSKKRCSNIKHHSTSKNCANCLTFALEWREDLLKTIHGPKPDGVSVHA